MTTRARRWPIRSPPCAPARARFKARSMAWASVAATPISRRPRRRRSVPQNFEIGVTAEKLTQLTRISHALDELLNRAPNRHAPYVGASAFATKAGIHASAVLTDLRTYEHVPPESVGNRRRAPSRTRPAGRIFWRKRSAARRRSREGRPALDAPARRRRKTRKRRGTLMRAPTHRSFCWRSA